MRRFALALLCAASVILVSQTGGASSNQAAVKKKAAARAAPSEEKKSSAGSRSEAKRRRAKPAGRKAPRSATRRTRSAASADATPRARERFPAVTLVNPRSGETLAFRPYDEQGKVQRAALVALTRFMSCHRTKRRRAIAWALARDLYRIGRAFPGREITIYSGYRHQRVSRLRGSYHIKGMAADIAVAGVAPRTLRDFLLARFAHAGIGYYPQRPFVHFDVRGKRAFWVDFSGARQRGRYADDPQAVLLAERSADLPAGDDGQRSVEEEVLSDRLQNEESLAHALLSAGMISVFDRRAASPERALWGVRTWPAQ